MSLQDCPQCWNTPCTCGYMYKDMSESSKFEIVSAILGKPYHECNQKDEPCKVLKELTNSDYNHLAWIYGRMIHEHQESANVDYMIRFADILKKMCPDYENRRR